MRPFQTRISRRDVLAGGAAWTAFAAMVRRGNGEVSSAPVRARASAQACIFVNLNGAPSHVDTFDPKDGPWNPPDADLQQHGRIVLSNTLFPQLSKTTGDLCILRSVRSWEAAHERGQFYMQTAHPSNPAFVAETPHMGAVVALEKSSSGPLPPFLSLNGSTSQGATFLGGKLEPLAAPANQAGLTTAEHNFFGSNSQARFLDRYKLLQDLDASLRANPYDKSMADHAAFYESARNLMYDPAIAAVFRFSADDEERYGVNNFGRACIVARNAIRARNGTAFININHGGWDTHQNMFDRRYAPNMYQLCGNLDQGLGALIADLRASGDLARTLIVVMGEFGRTPGILNNRGGRDHFKEVMCVLMAGGGVRGGQAIGATNAEASKIVDAGWKEQRAIVMEDIAATVYSALGINWTKSITDTPSGRKFEFVPFGAQGVYTAIEEVFG